MEGANAIDADFHVFNHFTWIIATFNMLEKTIMLYAAVGQSQQEKCDRISKGKS